MKRFFGYFVLISNWNTPVCSSSSCVGNAFLRFNFFLLFHLFVPLCSLWGNVGSLTTYRPSISVYPRGAREFSLSPLVSSSFFFVFFFAEKLVIPVLSLAAVGMSVCPSSLLPWLSACLHVCPTQNTFFCCDQSLEFLFFSLSPCLAFTLC